MELKQSQYVFVAWYFVKHRDNCTFNSTGSKTT